MARRLRRQWRCGELTSSRSVDAHLAELLDAVAPLTPFPVGLAEARGCVAAADLLPAWPLPAFPSAMADGYAVRLDDFPLEESLPRRLRVADVLLVGTAPDTELERGTAVRVAAGGPVPLGTEAVVAVANTDAGMVEVEVTSRPSEGENLVLAGRDVPEGSVVVAEGQLIDSQLIGLLAAVGRNSVYAHPHPRVVVMSVGDDLVEVGQELQPGQSVDANGPMIAARAVEAGANVYRVGPVAEEPLHLLRTLEDQLVRADLILITTGQAAQTPDQVRHVLQQLGRGELVDLLMQPGSLHGFGVIGEEQTPVIVLPAMPLAAFVAFEVFVRPVLRKLRGLAEPVLPAASALIDEELTVAAGRRNYLSAEYVPSDDGLRVRPLKAQDSHLIGGLAAADCVIVLPELVVNLSAGDPVDILPLRERRP